MELISVAPPPASVPTLKSPSPLPSKPRRSSNHRRSLSFPPGATAWLGDQPRRGPRDPLRQQARPRPSSAGHRLQQYHHRECLHRRLYRPDEKQHPMPFEEIEPIEHTSAPILNCRYRRPTELSSTSPASLSAPVRGHWWVSHLNSMAVELSVHTTIRVRVGSHYWVEKKKL